MFVTTLLRPYLHKEYCGEDLWEQVLFFALGVGGHVVVGAWAEGKRSGEQQPLPLLPGLASASNY